MTATKKAPENKKKQPSKKKPSLNFLHQVLLVLLLFAVLSWFTSDVLKKDEDTLLSISELVQEIKTDNVESIVVKGEALVITLRSGDEKDSKKEREASLTETLVNYGVTPAELALVSIDINKESGFGYWVGQVLPFLFPLLFLGVLLWFLMGQVKGAGMKAFSFGQSKARVVDPNDQSVTFKDVAGNESAKQELEEIVEFLKHPKKFFDVGAKIPKGVILMGAPGTGKTLLARAVAGEAGVPFFHLSGSEFVEMFVGVGASRVRDLFTMAKKAAPAIIFIDEIDAVGRSRGVGVGGGNDEREQTLNQILVEMDGFDPHQKVIVIAATNRMDVLDSALMRPGRFDRRVTLDIPDRKDRDAILQIHARNKPLASDVDLTTVAQRTPGFSGADLESLMNEAAILAARTNKKEINQKDILNSIDKVLIGPERKDHLHTPKERRITAYHEAGHAVVASVLPYADPVHKVSIVARGYTGGYTLSLPDEDRKMKSKKEFIANIAMSLGGYAAEEMIFDDITPGPSNDLQVATQLARNMVTKWGMSDAIGPVALEGAQGKALFGQGVQHDYHSDYYAKMVDEEVRGLMLQGLSTAREMLTEYRNALDAVAEELLKEETLEQDAYEAVITKHGITLPEKKDSKGRDILVEKKIAKVEADTGVVDAKK
ncbi:MAG: cell division protease FtsH [Planctomycetota bacterium]|jgi:cell division protease FtsH